MKTFQQLIIFDLKEVKEVEVRVVEDRATIYDISTPLETATAVGISKRYFLGSYNYKPLVVIFNDPRIEDPYHNYLAVIYNLYAVLVMKQTVQVSFQEMEQKAEQLTEHDKNLHWIWFKDKDTYLPDKIMSRAKSWIELNPDFTFYLWTNLIDPVELDDFISTLHESNRQYFTNGRIIVKYHDELLACLDDFCQQYGSQLRCSASQSDAEIILRHLFDFKPSVTKAVTTTVTTNTHTTTTTVIETVAQNNYKVNRIFKVDLWRIIVLIMHGGIYCDFNDTICFYPMKYLLTFYPDTFFVGTDYDIEHPIFRNNYFIYTSYKQPEFIDLSIRCINKGTKEYLRITDPGYITQYYELCLDFLLLLNQQSSINNNEYVFVSLFLQLERMRIILDQDRFKDPHRVITMVAEIIEYFSQDMSQLKAISQRLLTELDQLDVNCLKVYRIKQKNRRRIHRPINDVILPVNYDREAFDKIILTYQFHDHFLMKYAIHMTVGDLILYTNISYIDEVKNLVPYGRSNRLSTISMLTHVYDGTSYGLTKNYESFDQFTNDLRREFL